MQDVVEVIQRRIKRQFRQQAELFRCHQRQPNFFFIKNPHILNGRSGKAFISRSRFLSYRLKNQGRARGGARGGPAKRSQGLPTGGPPGADKPKREAILDLSKYVNERIRVKFTGGREGEPCSHSFYQTLFFLKLFLK